MRLAVAVISSCAALAQAGTTIEASVDLTAAGTPFAHYWKRCVGSGHMLLGTREDWRSHLTLAVRELGFTGIRGHGVFDDDMSVLPRRGGDYEFYNVDQVFDFLLSLKVKPVVELSFMPSALVTCGTATSRPCSYAFDDHGGYKGLVMPPDNFEDWYDLVAAFAKHLVARYGLQEVASWHFEVWNEMWGVSYPEPYLSLYNASARAVKAVDPSLRIGGPATMQVKDIGAFIKAVQGKVPVDFVSTHFYPTDPQCQTNETKADRDCFAHTVLAAQKLAKDAGLPFFITEYNDGLGRSSRDDSSAAAFVFRHMGLMEQLDMFSWWTFSDVFEENWMQSAPFHNGYGMMTVQGVRKPVWRAFQLLAGAGDTRLPVSGSVSPARDNSDISVLATKSGADFQLFVASYRALGAVSRFSCDAAEGRCREDPAGTFTDEALCDANCGGEGLGASAGLGAGQPLHNVTLTFQHPASARWPAAVDGFRIDAAHANPMAKWKELGSPKYPTAAEVASMAAASELGPAERIPVSRLSATTSAVSFQMPSDSVLHIAFRLSSDPSVVV